MEKPSDMHTLFNQFSMGEKVLENKQFNKIFKDSGILDGKKLTTTDLDIIFAKNKKKEEKKMGFDHFVHGFADVAAKLKLSSEELLAKCHSGPIFHGTKAEKVALHDDKSNYTGVYAKGGPTTVDKGKGVVSDLSELANRKDANIRGVNNDIKQM